MTRSFFMEMHRLAILLILLVLIGEEHDYLLTRPAVLAKSLPVLKRNKASKRKFISRQFSQKYAGYARRYHYGDYNITSNPSPFESKLYVKKHMALHKQSVNSHARILPSTKNFQKGYRTRSDSRLGAIEARAKKPQVRKRHHITAMTGVQTEAIESSPSVQVGGHHKVKLFGFPNKRRPGRKSKRNHVKAFHHFYKIPHNRCMKIHIFFIISSFI